MAFAGLKKQINKANQVRHGCDGIIKNAFQRQALRAANWVRVAGENGISLVRGEK